MKPTLLALLSSALIFLAVFSLAYVAIREGLKEFIKYIITGFFVAVADFFVEFLGTAVNKWVYNASIYLILGEIPLELPLLFFSGGVLARFIYEWSRKVEKPFNLDTVLYVLTFFGVVFYARGLRLLDMPVSIMYIAVPVGLWGIVNIKEQENRVSAMIFAAILIVADALIETFIIHAGEYAYASGFNWNIPISYGLFLLGLFGFMEKLDIIDQFFSHPFPRKILSFFGVKKKEYVEKLKEAVSD